MTENCIGTFRQIGTIVPSPVQIVIMAFRRLTAEMPRLEREERRKRLCEALGMLAILHRAGIRLND